MVERIKTFDEYREYKYELAGRPLVVKTGKIAGLANGAAMVQYGIIGLKQLKEQQDK